MRSGGASRAARRENGREAGRRRARAWAVALTLSAGAASAGPLAIEGGRIAPAPGLFGGVERVEVDLTERPAFRLFTLDDPPRIVADLPPAELRAGAVAAPAAARLAAALRFGFNPGEGGAMDDGAGSRVVVDLRRPARVVRAWTEDAGGARARLVLEIAPEPAAAFAALAGWPEATRHPAPPPPPDVDGTGPLVMIDPGHGGADPGAISRGIAEKDLALDYARAVLAALARRPGIRARLTREGDEYLTLSERVALARAAGASLFLSIHADALANGEAAGASVYLLSEAASDAEAAALAEGHELLDALAGTFDGAPPEAAEGDVARVLVDLARRRAEPSARRFAERLVARLGAVAPLLEGRALQSAGFRVLRAPEIPSALLELGFLSSAEDRARLLSAAARDETAEAVAAAIADWAAAEE